MAALTISALAARSAQSTDQQEATSLRTSLFDGKTLNGWVQVQNNATSLAPGSVPDPALFSARLAQEKDPVASFLYSQFDSALKTDLGKSPASDPKAVLSATVKQINQILAGPGIFTTDRFRGVMLRSETEDLLRENPRGIRLTMLNKMLIEDAFPEIVKSETTGWIVKDGVMASTGAGRGVIYSVNDYSRFRLLYNVRHVSGHPDHQAGVLFFCKRPEQDEMPLDALGGIQFQLPMGSYWDYRPANNNSGSQFFTTITKSPFDRHAWSQVELLVDAAKGTAQLAVAQPPGSKAIELVRFSDPTAGRRGPIAFQMHNAGLFDEYKDISIEIDPEENLLLTTK